MLSCIPKVLCVLEDVCFFYNVLTIQCTLCTQTKGRSTLVVKEASHGFTIKKELYTLHVTYQTIRNAFSLSLEKPAEDSSCKFLVLLCSAGCMSWSFSDTEMLF